MVDLPAEDKKFIIDKAVEGWDAELIGYTLRTKENSPIRDKTVEEFLGMDSTQERISKEKSLIEKRQEVSREDLIGELNQQIKVLRERSEELRESDRDEISSDTTKNLLKAVRDLAEMIDVLEDKDDGSGNTVNINRLEQNFNMVEMVQHLPAEDKQGVVEQLEDDPDVEDFAIKRKKA